MKANEAFHQYPVLRKGIEIHLNPKGGTLFVDHAPYPISRAQVNFLKGCDGTHQLIDIMPAEWTEDFEDIKFMTFIAQLISRGFLFLSHEDLPSSAPRVTGSTTAFIPPHLNIELTWGCNLRCFHCYRDSTVVKQGYMPVESLLSLLERLSQAGLRSVELTGGEPMFHPDFLRILSFCDERFHLIGVLTNATIVTPAIREMLIRMKEKIIVSISLDGSTAEIHNTRRGSNSAFDRTTKTIQDLSQQGVKVRVSMTVDPENFDDLENTLLLSRNLGGFMFSYSPVLPFGRGADWALSGWTKDAARVLETEQRLAEKYKGYLGMLPQDSLYDLEQGGNCGAGYRAFAMDPWGNIRPCVTDVADSIFFGNLIDQSIEEVFGHPLTKAYCELVLPKREICDDCRFLGFCNFCAVRGFYASALVEHCHWINHPSVADIFQQREINSKAT